MDIFVLKSDEIASITRATHGNPHHILGMHKCLKDCYVNAYLPGAASVSVMDGEQEYPMKEIGSQGFFTVRIKIDQNLHINSGLQKRYGGNQVRRML